MKSKGLIITFIVLLVGLAVGLTIFMVKMLNGNTFFMFSHNVYKEKVLEEVYDISDIDIISNGADVYIKENIDNNIKVVVYGDKDRTSVKAEDNKLVVTSKIKKCRGFCINTKIAKIEVYIPAEYQNKLNINNEVGDIQVDSIKNLDLKITTKTGDIDIDSVKKANIKTKTGDIHINKVSNATIDSNVGDIKIGTVNEYLDLDSNTGDVKIETVNITKNSKIKTDVGDIKISSINDIYVDAKTNVGDTKIEKNNRKSNIELKIKSNVGDIKVK